MESTSAVYIQDMSSSDLSEDRDDANPALVKLNIYDMVSGLFFEGDRGLMWVLSQKKKKKMIRRIHNVMKDVLL